jgi:DNA-binding NtrC family response regulator
MKPLILVVDDEQGTRFGFSKYLSKVGYTVVEASCLVEARETVTSRRFDAVLLDLNLPDGSGLDWIPRIRDDYPDLPVIVITGAGDIPLAVEAMRRGADNFLTKPVDMGSLEVFLRKVLDVGAIRRRHLAEQRLKKKEEAYFGQSSAMKKVKELALLAAENDSSVLLTGATGTGKGMLAKWVHGHSKRGPLPFVEINCSGLKGELLASELFGHVRGAFTTAVRDRQGLIEVADGGTLFLDEIGDMDSAVQAQFLKVIEEKNFRRVGDTKVRRSDFRLICATNKDLQHETEHARFRKDLYFRIHVFPVSIPVLSERPDDLPGLVRHLLGVLGSAEAVVSPEAMQQLKAYPWPGNVRELRNVLERALLLSRGNYLAPEHFPGLVGTGLSRRFSDPKQVPPGKAESDIVSILQRFDGDVQKAAHALGVSRATLYRRIKKIKAH